MLNKNGTESEVGVQQFACDPEAEPSPSPLRRLSLAQYRNTLYDLFSPGPGRAVVDAAQEALDSIPKDGEEGAPFSAMDNRLSQRHIDAYYAVANVIADRATGEAHLGALAGPCALETQLSKTCLDDFLAGFGLRAYRRPLSKDELAFYSELSDGSEPHTVFRNVVFTFLMAPPFLYHFETRGQAMDGREDLLRLSAYELASRLSYHFWQSMPDAPLLKSAQDGSLLTEAGYREQISRVFASPRTQETIRAFYTEWFGLDRFLGFVNTARFHALAQSEPTPLDVREHDYHADMVQEIELLFEYYAWEQENGRFDELLGSTLSLTPSPQLARLYGVAPWDGVSEPPQLPKNERAGLLTRAAFLVTGDHSSAPFHRGAFIRRSILCDGLAQPNPNDLPPGSLTPPQNNGDLSTRQLFEAKTDDVQCQACHAQFNPIGFALETYDSLGRFRDEEHVFDADGKQIGTLPVDASVVPRIDPGDNTSVKSAVEMNARIVKSDRPEACFAKQYFEYTFRRRGNIQQDACAMESIRHRLVADDGGMKDALKSAVLAPAFQIRKVK